MLWCLVCTRALFQLHRKASYCTARLQFIAKRLETARLMRDFVFVDVIQLYTFTMGYIYFAHCGAAGFEYGVVKIGFSTEPIKRMISTRKGDSALRPYSVQLDSMEPLGVLPGTMRMEKAIHELFASYRVKGEWFRGDPKIFDIIRLFRPRFVLLNDVYLKKYGRRHG